MLPYYNPTVRGAGCLSVGGAACFIINMKFYTSKALKWLHLPPFGKQALHNRSSMKALLVDPQR